MKSHHLDPSSCDPTHMKHGNIIGQSVSVLENATLKKSQKMLSLRLIALAPAHACINGPTFTMMVSDAFLDPVSDI